MNSTSDTIPADAPEIATSEGMNRYMTWFVGGYLAVVLLLMLALRVTPSIDVFVVFVGIGVVLMGRGVAFVRDWAPFVLAFLAWEAMRGIANAFGQAVHSDSVIAIERLLFFGHVPTVDLQAALRTPGTVSALDVTLTFVYVSHFFFPLALALVMWLRSRQDYYRFVLVLMAVSFAAFFTFLVLPVAPPRFAGEYGEALPVADVMREVLTSLDWTGFSWMYRNLVGNPVAAFPSMHAAYPLLVLLFLRERWPRAALAWLPITLTIWFATVYLGHHYVIDVIGGAAYAVVGYYVLSWTALVPRLTRAYGRAFSRLRRDVAALLRPSKSLDESD